MAVSYEHLRLGSEVFPHPPSAMLHSEIVERELGPNDAQRWCAENADCRMDISIVNVNEHNTLNVNEDSS